MKNLEQIIHDTLDELMQAMALDYEHIEVVQDKETKMYHVNLSSENNSAILIGWHGETMMALQYVLKTLLWRKLDEDLPEDFFMVLDIDGYRERQDENVALLVQRKAEEVLETRRSILLPPMSAYFRRRAHLFVSEMGNEHLETESIGEGEGRRVKISYKD